MNTTAAYIIMPPVLTLVRARYTGIYSEKPPDIPEPEKWRHPGISAPRVPAHIRYTPLSSPQTEYSGLNVRSFKIVLVGRGVSFVCFVIFRLV